MNVVIAMVVALILTVGSNNAVSQEKESLLQNPKTQERVHKYCQDKHWRDPGLVSVCMQQQIEALAKVESYLEHRWQDIRSDNDHPVLIIFKESMKKSSVVVDGDPWADWGMLRFRFKRAMQDWLRAEGKTEELRVINSAL